ncbi:hypothetical protein LTS08_007182 [Lithohypha guttulata]|uniref:Uncharacterized protein n=1 Tax=Lithohypha guttulata TaxID=1690604 RepID=A0AAN7T216_9EURO|nr:hypothetical protein LTR51_005482 [Lithohypha guttulata]KAK5086769.1 hypothetical protein LTR05_003937 [Lithohypha guttulata]KAK5097161.1 hypothetical protein LTS08_007182 [Lithohypha guttulata]
MSAGVGPRVPKDDFMRALGLDSSDARHEGIYRAMRDEAIATYNLLNADRSNLVEEKQNDLTIRPPYFWHHISRERQQWAIIKTWQNAAPGTVQRQMFDRGATQGEHSPNWVTLWLLYSVFRSRDIRNNRNRRNGDTSSSGSGGSNSSGESRVRSLV